MDVLGDPLYRLHSHYTQVMRCERPLRPPDVRRVRRVNHDENRPAIWMRDLSWPGHSRESPEKLPTRGGGSPRVGQDRRRSWPIWYSGQYTPWEDPPRAHRHINDERPQPYMKQRVTVKVAMTPVKAATSASPSRDPARSG